ncbi:MAG: MBL fold metallo-hydrolase [Lachnospiraceae bacterium]|nr:MBL fold metallo-hydrolase [Lachnospiraceae bacterium]
MVLALHYSKTNTYLIKGRLGYVLWDTGWAGTFPAFCKELGRVNVPVSEIKYILVSHFHPDHMGIVQNIANLGPRLLVFDVQKKYVHDADEIFKKEAKHDYLPIDDAEASIVSFAEGKNLLSQIGVQADIIASPGHSEDSISLFLEGGDVFVGDLNPLYELELHRGTKVEESWNHILARNPRNIYYGHAKMAELDGKGETEKDDAPSLNELYGVVKTIIRYIDRGKTKDVICRKTGAEKEFVEDVMRMYLTHPGVSVQGILDRIEIKGK